MIRSLEGPGMNGPPADYTLIVLRRSGLVVDSWIVFVTLHDAQGAVVQTRIFRSALGTRSAAEGRLTTRARSWALAETTM